VGIPLKCFAEAGADMTRLDRPFVWTGHPGERIDITEVSLGTVADRTLDCPVKGTAP
jgi:beta-glucosidase